MAIQVNSPITTREGTDLTSYYIRLEVTINPAGDKLTVESYHYASKSAFQSGCRTIKTNEQETFDYNLTADGEAIAFAHAQVIASKEEEEQVNYSIVDLI